MHILEHGQGQEKTLLFLPCTAEPVWAFEKTVARLAQSWHVFQVVYDGHEPSYPGDFTSVEQTVDEITESVALDTDLKTWANAQGWKLSDEEQSVDISVDYDFDDENISEGIYQITFSTTGREFKIHTTDYVEEGKEVGLTFSPQDIHVMEKMEF